MSPNALKKLVGALIVLLVVWGAVALATRHRAPGEPAELGALLEDIRDTASLRAIRFETPRGETVELSRAGSHWIVNGHPADSGSVARFLTALADASSGALVARNPTTHARLGLSADSAYTVELHGRGAAETVLVGDAGTRYGTTYVRRPASDEAWLVEADLRTAARRSLDDWRSKRVVALDTAAVASLEVRRDGESYALARADTTWTLAGGVSADAAVVRGILGELHNLWADGFLAEGDSLAALAEGGALVARSAEGAEVASLRIGSGESERWLRSAGDSVTYRISSYRLDRLTPTRERLSPSGR